MAEFRQGLLRYELTQEDATTFRVSADLTELVADGSGYTISEFRMNIYFPQVAAQAQFMYYLRDVTNGTFIAESETITLQLNAAMPRNYTIAIDPSNINAYDITEYELAILPMNEYGTPVQNQGSWGGLTIDGSLSGSAPRPSNIAVDNTVMDNITHITWTATGHNYYEVSAYDVNGVLLYFVSGNTAAVSCMIPAGELGEGTVKIAVKVGKRLTSFNSNNACIGLLSDAVEYIAEFTRLKPIITGLEPNGINQMKNQPITVYWTCENQSSYYLVVSQEGVEKATFSGTTQKSNSIPANTLENGMTSIQLTVTYVPTWAQSSEDYVTAMQTVSFGAYGPPPDPVLTMSSNYNTSRPVITWTASEQISFQAQILKDNVLVLDSGEVYSTTNSYQFDEALGNNSSYVVRLRVKNAYDLYSNWVNSTFHVSFAELQQPFFSLFGNDTTGSITIDLENAPGQPEFNYSEVYRRELPNGDWLRIATGLDQKDTYVDYTCVSGSFYEYKVRAVDANDGYSDSNTAYKSVTVRDSWLFNAADCSDNIRLIYNPGRKFSYVREAYEMVYSGLEAPKVEYGESKYLTGSFSFFLLDNADKEKLLHLYRDTDLLLYKDSRGKKIYGYISSDISENDLSYGIEVSFSFTELHHVEGV